MNEVDYTLKKYNGNGTTKEFPFDWKAFAASDLIIKLVDSEGNVETLSLGIDYTVQVEAVGGNVLLKTAPGEDKIIVIARDVSNYQGVGYSTSTGFQGAEIEKSFDRISCNLQEMDYNIETFKTDFSSETNKIIESFKNDTNELISSNKKDVDNQILNFKTEVNNTIEVVSEAATKINQLEEAVNNARESADEANNSASVAITSANAAQAAIAEITTAAQSSKNEMQSIYEQFQEQVDSGALAFNAPFYLGASEYIPYKLSDIEQTNMSLLLSQGQKNFKKIYPKVYDFVLKNVNNGVEGFKGNGYGYVEASNSNYVVWMSVPNPVVGATVYGHSPCRKCGTIESVSGNTSTYYDTVENRSITLTRDATHDCDTTNMYWITDFDFVINRRDETFRLPLSNGEEDIVDTTRYINYPNPNTDNTIHIAPANGIVFFEADTGLVDGDLGVDIYNPDGSFAYGQRWQANTAGINQLFTLPIRKGYGFNIRFKAIDEFMYYRFYYNKGNGYLYYYVGDTVENADLINAGALAEALTLKADRTELLKKVDINSNVIDGQWKNTFFDVVRDVTLAGGTKKDYDVSSILPNDGCYYELGVSMSHKSSGVNSQVVVGGTDVNCSINIRNQVANAVASASGRIIVGLDRKIRISVASVTANNVYVSVGPCRRLGTNE